MPTLEDLKTILAGAAALLAVLFCTLWISTTRDYAQYKAEVVAAGKAAEKEAERINKQHEQTVEDVSNAWNSQLPLARKGAVAAYLATHPNSVPQPCGCEVPRSTLSAGSVDGAGQEPVATVPACQPDQQFIEDCAEDALKVGKWQQWADELGLKSQ